MNHNPLNLIAAEPPEVADLATVISNLQGWLVGILAAVATLFLVIGG